VRTIATEHEKGMTAPLHHERNGAMTFGMNANNLRPVLLLGAFATVPFLFGANGKGCQTLPVGPDAGPSDAGFCVDKVLCIQGDHWDTTLCKCVPNADAGPPDAEADVEAPDAEADVEAPDAEPPPVDASPDVFCVDNVLCIRGDHWDPTLCKCVPDADVDAAGPTPDAAATQTDAATCYELSYCVMTDHWDPAQCKCVPNNVQCTSPSECHGLLPQYCVASCPNGAPGACAHWACVNGTCVTETCAL
jgi:hypothetical protein